MVLLRNMVGPGEVDDDLEDEVGMECSKYGNVQVRYNVCKPVHIIRLMHVFMEELLVFPGSLVGF